MENKDNKIKKMDPGCLCIIMAAVLATVMGAIVDRTSWLANRCLAPQKHKQEQKQDSIQKLPNTPQLIVTQKTVRSK